MTCACGCCEGLGAVTPLAIDNRPGLAAVRTRIGTHASFLETMLARLSSADYPELAALRTRDPGDASIALLDGWATVADVLTFYQERIANEGYLRTATERRSLVELARLIGYGPRPGVAASVYLAFGLEKDARPVVIPKGSKFNSIPAPGETMQAFETSEPVEARVEWGSIRPRLVQPQTVATVQNDGLYLQGTATKLKPGDMLMIKAPGTTQFVLARVRTVDEDHANNRTHIGLPEDPPKPSLVETLRLPLGKLSLLSLMRAKTIAPRSAVRLQRTIATSFSERADTVQQLLTDFRPSLSATLYQALRGAPPEVAQAIEVYAMRIEARAFGYNAPLGLTKPATANGGLPVFAEWKITSPWNDTTAESAAGARSHLPRTIYLDNDYPVADKATIAIEGPGHASPLIITNASVSHVGLSAYGMSGKSVGFTWLDPDGDAWFPAGADEPFSTVRDTRVYLGAERLDLADAPIADDVSGATIELDGIYDGLASGRWLIVEGERTDIPDANGDPIPGIHAAELVMLGGVEQVVRQVLGPAPPKEESVRVILLPNGAIAPGGTQENDDEDDDPPPPMVWGPQPGDTYHSVIMLAGTTADGAAGLAYKYKRDTVIIHANVAHATHGETRTETLGSGNAAQALQQFALRQFPLTYVSAPTPSGIASTLEVRINDVLWHETASAAAIGPADRKFVTATGDDDKTRVVFGDGVHGARLPTGRENVTARYRNGIGVPGNVRAGQISLLGSRPLGLKDVVNPIESSGGADREGAESIRRNAPIALMAFDRLVSTADYADFARNFAGVGKAAAVRDRATVAVVIAGADDIPIEPSSDLFRNLYDALHRFGDPQLRVTLAVRERLGIVLKAGVRVDPDYLWEKVEPHIRAALLAAFSFEAQGLGQPAFLSHALRAIQGVRGVVSADIDVFDALPDPLDGGSATLPATLTTAQPRIAVKPNQIAYLSPQVADTLILQELPS
jgi:hypothetical protein